MPTSAKDFVDGVLMAITRHPEHAEALLEEAFHMAVEAEGARVWATGRWAVSVLDAWAETTRDKGYPEGWSCMPWHQGGEAYKCCLSGNGGRIFYGATAEAARILAAETLSRENPNLGRSLDSRQHEG